MIVYRTTHRVPVRIGEITFWISPLKRDQKLEIASQSKLKGGVEIEDNAKKIVLSVKYGVKQVDGLKNPDGSDYAVELGDDGTLTEDSLDDLLNGTHVPKLLELATRLGDCFIDPKIEGVTVDFDKVIDSKKK